MADFEKLREQWEGCRKCPIGGYAIKHVFGRGDPKSKVVFIGEGPGRSEDVIGLPFVGRAGKLLEAAIEAAGFSAKSAFFTNLLACRPCDKDGGPNRAPLDIEVVNCSSRLKDILSAMKPKAVVWLGRVPQSHAPLFREWTKARSFHLYHPAFILRLGGTKSDAFGPYTLRIKEIFRYAETAI